MWFLILLYAIFWGCRPAETSIALRRRAGTTENGESEDWIPSGIVRLTLTPPGGDADGDTSSSQPKKDDDRQEGDPPQRPTSSPTVAGSQTVGDGEREESDDWVPPEIVPFLPPGAESDTDEDSGAGTTETDRREPFDSENNSATVEGGEDSFETNDASSVIFQDEIMNGQDDSTTTESGFWRNAPMMIGVVAAASFSLCMLSLCTLKLVQYHCRSKYGLSSNQIVGYHQSSRA